MRLSAPVLFGLIVRSSAMDGIQKEVHRVLEKAPCLGINQAPIANGSNGTSAKKGQWPTRSQRISSSKETVIDALDELIRSLEEAKQSSLPSAILKTQLEKKVTKCSKAINDKHKEYYNSLSKLSKALDKKFIIPIDGVADYSLFQSQLAQGSLDKVIRDHLMRCGEWEVAKSFARVSGRFNASKDICKLTFFILSPFTGSTTTTYSIALSRRLSRSTSYSD